MTIDGNIKVFELSKALSADGATASATSGDSSAEYLLDFSKLTRWQSVGSDDVTAEVVTILFDLAAVSRLLFVGFNFKGYTVLANAATAILDDSGDALLDSSGLEIIDSGSVGAVDFTNVISATNSTATTGITETALSNTDQYYEFDQIDYLQGLQITITTTQTANAEKYCHLTIPTIELNDNSGTFSVYPALTGVSDYEIIQSKNLAGKNKVQKLQKVFSGALRMRNASTQNDVELFEVMRDTVADFLLYPSGGATYSDHFRFSARPYKLGDIFKVQVTEYSAPQYVNNITQNSATVSVKLVETY